MKCSTWLTRFTPSPLRFALIELLINDQRRIPLLHEMEFVFSDNPFMLLYTRSSMSYIPGSSLNRVKCK